MTFAEFASKYIVTEVWYSGFSAPAGTSYTLYNEDHHEFPDQYYQLEGEVEQNGPEEFKWVWNGEGNLRDECRSTVYQLCVYGSKEGNSAQSVFTVFGDKGREAAKSSEVDSDSEDNEVRIAINDAWEELTDSVEIPERDDMAEAYYETFAKAFRDALHDGACR